MQKKVAKTLKKYYTIHSMIYISYIVMKNTKKIITSLIILCWSFLCIANANNSTTSDCWTFASLSYNDGWFDIVNLTRWTAENQYTNFLTIDQQLAIIDTGSLNTAMLNLKKYCCENQFWWQTQQSDICKNDKEFFNNNALDSPYLFDHLFDVIMRRLIWLTGENDIYINTNMSVDKKWEERRARISEESLNITWSNPQIIIDKYQEVRKQSPSTAWYNIKDKIHKTFWDLSDSQFLTYVSWKWGNNENEKSESQQIAEAFKKYNEWTLYDRYDNACALAEYFYALLDVWVQSSDRYEIRSRLSNWYCNTMINQVIQDENSYVREVIQRESNLFIKTYVKEYLSYLQDRTNTLKDTRSKSKDRRLDVVRAVPKLIKKCVH